MHGWNKQKVSGENSMSSNEEYLDSLLNSMMEPKEGEAQPEGDAATDPGANFGLQDEGIATEADNTGDSSDFALEDIPEDDDILSALSAETNTDAQDMPAVDAGESQSGDAEMSMDDIDAMLASLAGDTSLDSATESTQEETVQPESSIPDAGSYDGITDQDTQDSGFDEGASADDDMLAMLESVPDDEQTVDSEEPDFDFFSGEEEFPEETEEVPSEDVTPHINNTEDAQDTLDTDFLGLGDLSDDGQSEDIFSGAEEASDAKPEETVEQQPEEKKEKKHHFFKGRNKKKKVEEQETPAEESENGEESSGEDMDALESLLQSSDEMTEEAPSEEKKKEGFWKRLLEFLMEEDEEDEEDAQESAEGELPMGNPTEENMELLEELSAEDKKQSKEKNQKKKNKKGKKGKKNQNKNPEEGEDEESEETAEPAKKKRKNKKKKQDEAALEEVIQEPEKKLSKKKVLTVFAFCGTLAACVILINMLFPGYMEKRDARVAYDQQNYEVAYDLLYGKKLNAEDEAVFQKSNVILQIQHVLKEYEVYQKLDMRLEALDVLVQTVSDYPDLLSKAEKYHVESQVSGVYEEILATLERDFGVSEVQAMEAAAAEDNVTYTKILTAMAGGTTYDPETGEEVTDQKQDILPEEEEFLEETQAEDTTTAVEGQE